MSARKQAVHYDAEVASVSTKLYVQVLSLAVLLAAAICAAGYGW